MGPSVVVDKRFRHLTIGRIKKRGSRLNRPYEIIVNAGPFDSRGKGRFVNANFFFARGNVTFRFGSSVKGVCRV